LTAGDWLIRTSSRRSKLRATVPRWQGMSGGVRYVWDAENRLRAVIPAIPVAGQDRKVEYGYDYLGRRVIRRTYDWDGQALAWTGPVEVTKYVYNGWRVIMELDGLAGDIPTRKFSWGLDLAAQAGQLNSLESAGGIGGLLAAEDSAGTGTTGVHLLCRRQRQHRPGGRDDRGRELRHGGGAL
jgi:hypothetical protein